MVARNRGKLWLNRTEENYGCNRQMKTMAARNRGKLWLKQTEGNYSY
jgi:hypothetical protein